MKAVSAKICLTERSSAGSVQNFSLGLENAAFLFLFLEKKKGGSAPKI
jgi:hypothetical protein